MNWPDEIDSDSEMRLRCKEWELLGYRIEGSRGDHRTYYVNPHQNPGLDLVNLIQVGHYAPARSELHQLLVSYERDTDAWRKVGPAG